MKLSIIIPVYNEENTIEEILKKVKSVKLPQDIEKEIIVVDDGSTDRSILKIKSAENKLNISYLKLIRHNLNKGKGSAILSGIKKATGDIIIIQDADLEYNPEDYVRLLEPILDGKSEVVYGSRLKHYPLRISGSRKTPLVTHYLGNKLLTLLTNLLYGNGVTDMETCYKVFKKEVLKDININAKRFDFEPEITAKILKKGFKIYEIPIKVKPRGYEEGKKISWKDGFIALWTLLKYRFID
jgi:dolichol-phosphate mannosyltransferase